MRVWWTLAAVTAVLTVGAAALLVPDRVARFAGPEPFPAIDRSALSDVQVRIVEILQAQFETQPEGEVYAGGVTEPWCADFVSWVMKEAGVGLVNPHSGGWRIPGVYTLQEFYQSTGRFEGPEHRPTPGDVAIYADGSPLGLHTNVVVAANGASMTTVGGNEEGAVRVRTVDIGPGLRLLGYGRLV
ncbi:CHAP domain-containing protein [Mycobacterium manitobense]|uniref:CHAP domain-containing protein n=2 Tax=[Mycobacterium] manitobense TaxID=190147 RepID=A0A9X3BVW4_9MYCO|nr:CHAP domain-containing protein [[Mycobacterium] manitobense]